MPRATYFATVLRCRPVRRAIAETVIPCWCNSNITISSANLTTHRLPRHIGGEVASVRTPFRRARLSQHSACRPRIEMSDFQPPDLARIHPAMTQYRQALQRAQTNSTLRKRLISAAEQSN